MKGALPRLLTPPILFALGAELDHMFGSRWLNTQLLKLGFSASYSEVICFKQTVVMTEERFLCREFHKGAKCVDIAFYS